MGLCHAKAPGKKRILLCHHVQDQHKKNADFLALYLCIYKITCLDEIQIKGIVFFFKLLKASVIKKNTEKKVVI